MATSHEFLTGEEFVRFVESHSVWPKVLGTTFVNADLGNGTIESIRQRKDGVPLLDIKFSSEPSTSLFNSHVFFQTGNLTNIQIPDELSDLLTEWRERISKERSLAIAAEAEREKKKYFTEQGADENKVNRLPDAKSKMENTASAYVTEARLLTPNELNSEIRKMQQNKNQNAKLNIRLTTFKDVKAKREDCHPLGREVRVKSTS